MEFVKREEVSFFFFFFSLFASQEKIDDRWLHCRGLKQKRGVTYVTRLGLAFTAELKSRM